MTLKHLFSCIIIGWALLMMCPEAYSDRPCEIVDTIEKADGTALKAYTIKIDNRTYSALPTEIADNLMKKDAEIAELQKQLKAAQKYIAKLEVAVKARQELSTVDDVLVKDLTEVKERYKRVAEDFQQLGSQYKSMTEEYQKLTGEYRAISEGYRSLAHGPTVTADVGVGITGSDTDPAVMFGIGFRRFRIWGFFQEDNSGALLGYSMPLF